MQNMVNAKPFYYITESEMSTKVIRTMAPWLAQGKLEILSKILQQWMLTAAATRIRLLFGVVPLLRKMRDSRNELLTQYPEKPTKGFWNG